MGILSWEWNPVVTRCRRLIAWTLLLTVLCQSALPCDCAQCGYAGESCCDERLHEQSRSSCCHDRPKRVHGALVSRLTADPQSHGSRTPAPNDSPCRRLVTSASAEGSSLRVPLGEAHRTWAFIPAASIVDVRCHGYTVLRSRDLGPRDPSWLARTVRLQV